MSQSNQEMYHKISQSASWEDFDLEDPAIQGMMHCILCNKYKRYGSFAIIPTSKEETPKYGIAVFSDDTLIPIWNTPFMSYSSALISGNELFLDFVLKMSGHLKN